jgi:hypothetical protein
MMTQSIFVRFSACLSSYFSTFYYYVVLYLLFSLLSSRFLSRSYLGLLLMDSVRAVTLEVTRLDYYVG